MENKLKIRLTGRPPVSIDPDVWEVLAEGRFDDHDNEHEFQANRKWKARMWVRQSKNTDKIVVHGQYDYETSFRDAHDIEVYAGELIDDPDEDMAEVCGAISRTAQALIDKLQDETMRQHVRIVAQQALGDLPEVELE